MRLRFARRLALPLPLLLSSCMFLLDFDGLQKGEATGGSTGAGGSGGEGALAGETSSGGSSAGAGGSACD